MSRVLVTGGTGFIGRALVRQLRERGDSVTAIVRDPSRAQALTAFGAEVVPGDVTGDAEHLAPLMVGHDAVVHLAGDYRIGIRPDERDAMWAINVTAVERAIDAAIAVGVPMFVHVSTANAMGNTRGQIVDETYRRDLSQGFVSWYDETKFRGHEAAERRIAQGDPVLIAMPGTAYGPDDHSQIGDQLRRAFAGTLRYRALDDVGTSLVHVDDEAARIARSWIAAVSARRMSWPGRASDSAMGSRSRPDLVAAARPGCDCPRPCFGRWRPLPDASARSAACRRTCARRSRRPMA